MLRQTAKFLGLVAALACVLAADLASAQTPARTRPSTTPARRPTNANTNTKAKTNAAAPKGRNTGASSAAKGRNTGASSRPMAAVPAPRRPAVSTPAPRPRTAPSPPLGHEAQDLFGRAPTSAPNRSLNATSPQGQSAGLSPRDEKAKREVAALFADRDPSVALKAKSAQGPVTTSQPDPERDALFGERGLYGSSASTVAAARTIQGRPTVTSPTGGLHANMSIPPPKSKRSTMRAPNPFSSMLGGMGGGGGYGVTSPGMNFLRSAIIPSGMSNFGSGAAGGTYGGARP